MKEKNNTTIDFREESVKWNSLRAKNIGAYTQSEWSRLARDCGCAYAQIVAKALTDSPFFEKEYPYKAQGQKYLFVKPVTMVFVEGVIEKQRRVDRVRVSKVSKRDRSRKAVNSVKVVGEIVGNRFDMRVVGESGEVLQRRIITEEQFEMICLFSDTYKDEQLRTIYKVNRSEFTVTPIGKEVLD